MTDGEQVVQGDSELKSLFPAKSYTGATSVTFGRETMFADSGSPCTMFVWVTLEGQIQGHSDFKSLISCRAAALGHMLPLDINRKAYLGSLMVCLHFNL